jgi:hypothetical protein
MPKEKAETLDTGPAEVSTGGSPMVCALTERKLRAGTFEQFREAFMQPVRAGQMPAGWRHLT